MERGSGEGNMAVYPEKQDNGGTALLDYGSFLRIDLWIFMFGIIDRVGIWLDGSNRDRCFRRYLPR